MANEKRYYYKTTDESGWLNLKTPAFDGVEGYVAITEEEWNEHIAELEKPSEENEIPEEILAQIQENHEQEGIDMPILDPIVVNNPKEQRVQPLSKDDVVAIVNDGIENGTISVGSEGSTVVANPTLVGGESNLTGLEVDGTKYKVDEGTEVVANPTLAGTETELTGLEVGDTKYKVGGGTKLYKHIIRLRCDEVATSKNQLKYTDSVLTLANSTVWGSYDDCYLVIISTRSTAYTKVKDITDNFSEVVNMFVGTYDTGMQLDAERFGATVGTPSGTPTLHYFRLFTGTTYGINIAAYKFQGNFNSYTPSEL